MHKRPSWQILVSVGLVVLTEVLYRTFPLEGFNNPFVKDQNFGTFFDQLISDGSRDGWVSFNAIPTAAHTIWGVLCGKLLLSSQTDRQKLRTLVIAGVIALAVGYSLTTVSPIIKRIATSSFVFVSGGYTILVLALTYWIIDMKQYKNWAMFGVIVGMNPLFIYLFNHFGFSDIVQQIVEPWYHLVLGWTDQTVVEALARATVWFFNWYLCYLLYKRKIFVRI
jgi:predicted acyltransferase